MAELSQMPHARSGLSDHPPAGEGVFPDGRLDFLLRASLGKEDALGPWVQYLEALGPLTPNEGETRLYPLVAVRLGASVAAAPWADQLLKARRWARIQGLLLKKAKDRISDLLQQAGIPALLTKGMALGQMVYRHDEIRVSQDVDVIVQWEDIPKVAALADAQGWVPKVTPRGHDGLAYWESSEISFAIPGLADVDFSWQPRKSFAYDPNLKNWLWKTRNSPDLFQVANPTWLLLETFDHGLSGNTVFPIRWVMDAVMLLDRCGPQIDWQRLLDFTVQYRLVMTLRHGLKTVAAYTDSIPTQVLAQLATLKVTVLEEQQFLDQIRLDDMAQNSYSARAFNLLLRANSEQFQVLCARLWMASVADLQLRARLERRLADAKAGLEQSWSPDTPIVDPTSLPSQLEAEAKRFTKEGHPTLAHFHWKAACGLAPQNMDYALAFANTLHATAGPAAALTALQDLCGRHPDFLGARQLLAAQLVRMSSYSEAVAVCDAILAEHPKAVPALAARAESLRHLRRPEAALADLRRIAEIVPHQSFYRIKLANLLFTLGRHDQVMELGKGLPIGGPWTELNIIVARAHARCGDATGANLLFATLIGAEPDNPKIGAAWLQEDLAANDAASVKARLIAFVLQYSHDIVAYRLVLTGLGHLPGDPDLWRLINDAPLRLRQSADFQLTILQEACQREGRAEECHDIIKVQDRDNLSADAGLTLVNALWSRGEVESAYGRLNELLGRFPKHLNILRTCIIVFGARGPDALRKVKTELIKRLSPLEKYELLSSLSPEIQTKADRALMSDTVS